VVSVTDPYGRILGYLDRYSGTNRNKVKIQFWSISQTPLHIRMGFEMSFLSEVRDRWKCLVLNGGKILQWFVKKVDVKMWLGMSVSGGPLLIWY
jgi:hypothetical protein